MKVFVQELRKILRPLPLLILAVFTLLFAFAFLRTPYNYLNNYPLPSDAIKMTAELKELVGEPVTPEKVEAGLAFLREQVGDETMGGMYKRDFIDGTLAVVYENYAAVLENIDTQSWVDDANEKARIMELAGGEELMNIMPPYGFLPATGEVFLYLAVMILLTNCILFAPVITRDNMSGMRALQYSSKAGRKTLNAQLCAMLAAAAVIAVIEIALTFAVFLQGTWGSFLDAGVHSFFNPYSYSWFSGTFGQWLLCCALLILVVSLAATFFVFILSKVSKNYISLLLGLVPVAAVLVLICVLLFTQPFLITVESHNGLYQYLPIPFIEAYVGGLLLLASATGTVILLKRQKRAEIA
jgi:hypothetical protein